MRQPYRIEAIALHRVGVFEDMELRFPPIESAEADATKAEIHVFTGPNGCGKSTLLFALAEIFRPREDPGLVRSRFRGEGSGVVFAFSGEEGYFGEKIPSVLPGYDSRAPVMALYRKEKSGVFSYGPVQASSPTDPLNLYKDATGHPLQGDFREPHDSPYRFFAAAYSGQRTAAGADIAAIKPVDASPFDKALSFDGTARPQVLLQWIANNRAQSALAKQDGDTAAAAAYDLALSRITTLIRDICDLDLEFRLERSPLAVSVRLNGDNIRFDGLPDGLKSIISWVGDLSLRLEAIPWELEQDVFAQPIILFLDEVDIHLHPKWQRRILPAIQRLLPNAQVFVSTHSPFVVGSVEDAWVYRLPGARGRPHQRGRGGHAVRCGQELSADPGGGLRALRRVRRGDGGPVQRLLPGAGGVSQGPGGPRSPAGGGPRPGGSG